MGCESLRINHALSPARVMIARAMEKRARTKIEFSEDISNCFARSPIRTCLHLRKIVQMKKAIFEKKARHQALVYARLLQKVEIPELCKLEQKVRRGRETITLAPFVRLQSRTLLSLSLSRYIYTYTHAAALAEGEKHAAGASERRLCRRGDSPPSVARLHSLSV